jgi:hypothetical protein
MPKSIVNALKPKKGDRLGIYTDGNRIYIHKEKEPEL